MRLRTVLLAVVVAASVSPARGGPAPPYVEGPDVPAVTAPDRVVTVFDDEWFDGCAGKVVAARAIDVPAGTWDRILLEFTGRPDGDPWDRLVRLTIGGAEVLRATTPRTAFTLRRDITEYASLLPPGGTATVALEFGTYVGRQLGTVKLEFYADEPTGALVRARWDRVHPVLSGTLGGNGTRVTRAVTLPAATPIAASVDLYLSNHGSDEANFFNRRFHVLVDGTEIAVAPAMPYRYAFLGFGNGNANTACAGPGTSAFGDLVHPVMWWTAQQAADRAGVHGGVGEIPPYRAEVEPQHLSLLAGARTIEVVQENGLSYWPVTLSLLVEG